MDINPNNTDFYFINGDSDLENQIIAYLPVYVLSQYSEYCT